MAWSPPACQRRNGSLLQAGDYATNHFHHIHDGTLKLKRSMHGRAKLDLLRQRLLLAA